MSRRALIGFQRRGSDFTLAGGNWNPDYPLTNLQNDVFARVARSVSADNADTIITGTAASLIPVGLAGFGPHNMQLSATYRLRLYDETGSPTVLLWDSGIRKVWPSVYTYAGRYWSTYNFWSGQYTEGEISGQIPFVPIIPPEVKLSDYFVLEFFDDTNPDGYVQVGVLDINEGWEVSVNPENGSSYGYKQYTRMTQIEGGLKRFDTYQPSYVFQGNIPVMNREEVQNKAVELWRQHDIHRPFMWVPEPDQTTRLLREAKLVTLVDPGLFGYINSDYESVPLNLEEWKG